MSQMYFHLGTYIHIYLIHGLESCPEQRSFLDCKYLWLHLHTTILTNLVYFDAFGLDFTPEEGNPARARLANDVLFVL